MKLTFITNYMTHHQLPFCLEMYRILGDDFRFVATNAMEAERKDMGWDKAISNYPFMLEFTDGRDEALILESDIVLCGGTHHFFIEERLNRGLPTFRYFERLYKDGRLKAFIPTSYIRKIKEHTLMKNKPVYLLCAGAYVAGDFSLFGAYKDKMFKWGYFTAGSNKSYKEIEDKRTGNRIEILWSGRMLDWKHPELAVQAVEAIAHSEIKTSISAFHLTMVGNGPERENIEEYIKQKDLAEYITIKDFLPNDELLELMEKSHIYLMTSDYKEGWGAVVNEAMERGMAVIASRAAGAVPYLIKDSENGIIFSSGDVKELTEALINLISDSDARHKIGENAYKSLKNLWSPRIAAERFVKLSNDILKKQEIVFEEEGPISKA